MNTGRSGMMAAKTAIATTGHNVANVNTEGYSRQRVQLSSQAPHVARGTKIMVGHGADVSRVERVNDEYIGKQLRNAERDLAHAEEKDVVLKQAEDIFNEMNGEGMNRLISRFFNEFRKLSNDPDSEAIRQSVREASQALVNDFHRVRRELIDVRNHIDARIEGNALEANSLADQIKELNLKIKSAEIAGASPNDLLDKRDEALRKLGSFMELTMHKDKDGAYIVDVVGVGPLVAGPTVERFSVFRSPADDQGKPEGAFDLATSASSRSIVTHQIKGGKMGALLDARDHTLSVMLTRLDDLAYNIAGTVNQIHTQGFTREGFQGVNLFSPVFQRERAAEFINLSDEVKHSVNNIAAAAIPDAPGDNRIAVAISGLQHQKIMSNGTTTMDDFFNSIISEVGVTAARNRSTLNQQKDIRQQLAKLKDQISGVSIDEETTNLLQFQHAFDASAKVIQVADDMLKTILEIKR
ncbi:MAG: flagellar hook-associated protein FlgK [Bdellovibrionales bacterium RIFOXYD1_FULL_53_11]|nr:MAG: flagellar hook-associated protein FlgK [Bdellovibrionales bacterium RIFOXYD1_FULL_53_11]